MTDDIHRAARAAALRVELPDGSEITIPPPSLQQAADALRLDPRAGAEPETDKQRVLRMQKQAAILFGKEHAPLLETLTMMQVGEIVQALYLVASGIDPASFVAYQAALREQARRTAAETLADIDSLTIDLAAELRITPAEAAKMPVADAVAVRNRLAKNTHERAKFTAAVHGRTLD